MEDSYSRPSKVTGQKKVLFRSKLEKHTFIKLLGEGSFGSVFQAQQKQTLAMYALKIVELKRPKKTKKCSLKVGKDYYSEVIHSRNVKGHENIVSYKGYWIDNLSASYIQDMKNLLKKSEPATGRTRTESCSTTQSDGNGLKRFLFIRSFYCDSGTLEDWLRSHDTLKSRDVVDIWFFVQNMALGIYHIHSKNLIHRDLKPDNIFLTKGPSGGRFGQRFILKIGDFGASWCNLKKQHKNHLGRPPSSTLKEIGYRTTNVGSKLYASPQIMDDDGTQKKKYTNKTDIFSFGLILFELLYPMKSMEERKSNFNHLRTDCWDEISNFPQQYEIMKILVRSMVTKLERERPQISKVLKSWHCLKWLLNANFAMLPSSHPLWMSDEDSIRKILTPEDAGPESDDD